MNDIAEFFLEFNLILKFLSFYLFIGELPVELNSLVSLSKCITFLNIILFLSIAKIKYQKTAYI